MRYIEAGVIWSMFHAEELQVLCSTTKLVPRVTSWPGFVHLDLKYITIFV